MQSSTKAAGWWHYDKTNWKSDDTGKINEAAYTTARRIRGEALKVTDKDDPAEAARHRETLIKWSRASEAQARLHAMVSLAESSGAVSTKVETFDQNTDLFNCLNTTIHLRTGVQSPHDPEDNADQDGERRLFH